MNVSRLFRTAYQTVSSIAPKLSTIEPLTGIFYRNIHHMCTKQYPHNQTDMYAKHTSSALLQVSSPMFNITCGLKMKTLLHRRCKSCILMWRNGRKYIMCKDKPRHNQVERKKKEYNTWLLTHASQSRVREW